MHLDGYFISRRGKAFKLPTGVEHSHYVGYDNEARTRHYTNDTFVIESRKRLTNSQRDALMKIYVPCKTVLISTGKIMLQDVRFNRKISRGELCKML